MSWGREGRQLITLLLVISEPQPPRFLSCRKILQTCKNKVSSFLGFVDTKGSAQEAGTCLSSGLGQ